jgi:hypothetical protein
MYQQEARLPAAFVGVKEASIANLGERHAVFPPN